MGDTIASLFLRVLHEVPQVLDKCDLGVATAPSLCWSALLAVLHGRIMEVRRPGEIDSLVDLCRKDTKVPVLTIEPRGALLAGLAQRVEPSARCVGRLEYAGAWITVGSARALHDAAKCLPTTNPKKRRQSQIPSRLERSRALKAMLDANAGSQAEIEVVELRPKGLFTVDETHGDLDVEQELFAGILATPQVLRHLKRLDLSAADLWHGTIASVAEALGDAGALECVIVPHGDLRGGDGAAVARLVRRCGTLRTLDCRTGLADEAGAAAIARAAAERGSVRFLTMRGQPCGDAIARALAESGGGSLEYLDLTDMGLTSGGASDLAAAYKTPNRLSTLNVVGNKLDGEAARALAALVSASSALTVLALKHNAIGPEGGALLFGAVAGNSALPLAIVDASWCGIGDAGAAAVGQMLSSSSAIKFLALEHNGIGDAGAQELARGLAANSSLTRLAVSDVGIQSAGLSAIAGAIATHRSLKSVKLIAGKADRSDDATCVPIRRMLGENDTLLELHFRAQVAERGWHALFVGLGKNKSLAMLSLSPEKDDGPTGRQFMPYAAGPGDNGIPVLSGVLYENTPLASLNLTACNLGIEGVDALADGLGFNYNLVELLLPENGFGSVGAGKLARALVNNTGLRRLDVGNCKIGPHGYGSLTRVVRERPGKFALGVSQGWKMPPGVFGDPPDSTRVVVFSSCERFEEFEELCVEELCIEYVDSDEDAY